MVYIIVFILNNTDIIYTAQTTFEICKADNKTKHHITITYSHTRRQTNTHKIHSPLVCCTRRMQMFQHNNNKNTTQKQTEPRTRGFVTFSLCFIIALYFGFEIVFACLSLLFSFGCLSVAGGGGAAQLSHANRFGSAIQRSRIATFLLSFLCV